MSEKLLELARTPATALANIEEFLAEVAKEYPLCATSSEREQLLNLHKATLDILEISFIEETDLPSFKQAREQHYGTMLVWEATVDGNVDPEILYAITQREIDAGRMDIEAPLRKLVIQAMSNS